MKNDGYRKTAEVPWTINTQIKKTSNRFCSHSVLVSVYSAASKWLQISSHSSEIPCISICDCVVFSHYVVEDMCCRYKAVLTIDLASVKVIIIIDRTLFISSPKKSQPVFVEVFDFTGFVIFVHQ